MDAKARKFFGTDGIRGKANGSLTPDLALRVGQAAGLLFQRGDHQHRVLIGKDTRLSCYMVEAALQAGFTSAGMDVLLTGPVPTPCVAMLTASMRADLGVMISASHNPFDDNGIKLFGPDGYKLSDETECAIEALLGVDLSTRLAKGARLGRARRIDGVSDRYIESAKRTLPKGLGLEGIRIVIDCANGAAYRIAPLTLRELGAEVFTIGTDPDGLNINADCGSTSPQALVREVLKTRADIGIALDGDADRVMLVDEQGRVIDGDQLLATVATSWKETDRLTNQVVVGTVMSNLALERYLAGIGISLVRAAVGDRYVLESMRTHDCNLGGEPSGHVIMSDYATTGDGLVAALQVLTVLKRSGKKLSEVTRCFAPVPQVLRNITHPGGDVLSQGKVQEAIREGERVLGGEGRLIVRASGTEPVIRIMGECTDPSLLDRVIGDIATAIRS